MQPDTLADYWLSQAIQRRSFVLSRAFSITEPLDRALMSIDGDPDDACESTRRQPLSARDNPAVPHNVKNAITLYPPHWDPVACVSAAAHVLVVDMRGKIPDACRRTVLLQFSSNPLTAAVFNQLSEDDRVIFAKDVYDALSGGRGTGDV